MESFRERILTGISSVIVGTFDSSTVKKIYAVTKVKGCEGEIAAVFSSFGLKLNSFLVEGTNSE